MNLEPNTIESCAQACLACHKGCLAAADARVAYSASASMLEIPDGMTEGLLTCAKLCGLASQALGSVENMQKNVLEALLEKCKSACNLLADRYDAATANATEQRASATCRSCAEWCTQVVAQLHGLN